MKKYFHAAKQRTRSVPIALLGLCFSLVVGLNSALAFSEPHTVFYGKVLGTASEQDFLITEGALQWTIQRADGHLVNLQTTLYAFHDNQFSYRLDVPHSVFALGLNDQSGVPMPPLPQSHFHASVLLDGEEVTLLGPAGSTFTTEQLLRTTTYRLDLGVDRAAVDSDGDGIPDWWEDLYGLDIQDPSDAHLDLSGDGITVLEAYLRGLDPTHDYRAPALLSEEIVVYPAGSTAIVLDTADVDSSADQIVYTLTALPHSGTLTLRNAFSNPSAPDQVLDIGASFTQADVLKGRLVYDHDGTTPDLGFFRVDIIDEDSERTPYSGDVVLLGYEPAFHIAEDLSRLEAQRLEAHSYALAGYVVMDSTGLPADSSVANPSAGLDVAALVDYFQQYGDDRAYLFIGGWGGNSAINGGHQDDVLVAGADGGTLTGGLGSDLFVFRYFDGSRYSISDFLSDGADQIDVSAMPAPFGGFLNDYVKFAATAGGIELQVVNGVGGVTNLVIELPGLTAADADLYDWVEAGQLLVGPLQLEPMVTIAATEPRAAQSGPTPGRFTLTRRGSLHEDLLINISLTGTAINGTDYVTIPGTVLMAAGQSTVDVEVMPYVTGHQGVEKVVNMALASGNGYRSGTQQSAQVFIENLIMVVELEVLTGIAIQDEGESALVRLRRRHVTSNDALIRLSYAGTAVRGTDYETAGAPLFVSMTPGQTQVLLTVTPRAAAQLDAGAKTARITILSDEDYLIKPEAGTAHVSLIARNDTLAGWQERVFAASDGTAEFASGDTGDYGVTHLQRYAFGLDPHTPSREGMPKPFLHEGRLAVSFRRPLSVTDVEYRVFAATDLMDWSATAIPMIPMAVPAGVTDPELVFYISDEAAEGAAHAFTVIEVEWTP